MATKLAKLLQLQVLASPGASPRPRRLVLWRDNHPDTGTASAVRRKSRPVLVCHWRPHSADGRLEFGNDNSSPRRLARLIQRIRRLQRDWKLLSRVAGRLQLYVPVSPLNWD